MAHFAKIENGVVAQVIVVDNSHEANGEAYLNSIGLEGTWIQTSYNANIRRKLAAPRDTYNAELDRFEPPKPHASWIWNEEKYAWEAPVPTPTDGQGYDWNESSQSWELVEEEPSA